MSSGFFVEILMQITLLKKDFSRIKVKFVPQGKRIRIRKFRKGHAPELTEFDFAIVEFNDIFNEFKNKALSINRRRKRSSQNLEIFEKKYPNLIKPAVANITQLANSSHFSKDPKKRILYQKSLAEIFRLMRASLTEDFASAAVLVLERGAILVNSFYNSKRNNLIRVIAKRLDYDNGNFGLGLANLRLPDDIKKFKKLHIQEDCIATGDSIGGTILALKKKGIIFNEVQIDAAVVVQTGAEFLRQYLKYLGVQKVVIKTGALCFKVDEHFYLRRIKEEDYRGNEYFVGDMGAWSEKLPETFNKIACWNKDRLNYVNEKQKWKDQ